MEPSVCPKNWEMTPPYTALSRHFPGTFQRGVELGMLDRLWAVRVEE